MKKFFTALVVAAMSLIPTALSAKTVTFTIDDPAAAYLYNTGNYSNIYFEGNTSKTEEISDNAGIVVNINSGFYLNDIKVGETTIEGNSYQNNFYIDPSVMEDGSTVNISTIKKESKTIYVVADPTQVTLKVDGTDIYNAENFKDGKWTISTTNEYPNLSFTCEDGYVIKSITKDGVSVINSYDSGKVDLTVYPQSPIAGGETYSVECSSLAELRTLHVSLEVMGSDDEVSTDPELLSKVKVQRGNYTDVPSSKWSDIALIPSSELPLIISSSSYNKTLYKCTLNGESQTMYEGKFTLSNLTNGDKIQVWPDYPDVNVPLTFEGFTDAITGITVDGEPVDKEVWSVAGYTVKLGSQVYVSLDTNNYSVESVTVNGESKPTYYCSFTVSSESAIKIVITGSKKEPYKVTLNYEPETIRVYNATYANPEAEITLSDTGTTEIEVPAGQKELYFVATEGNKITQIYNETTNSKEYSTSNLTIYSNCELTIYTEEFVRDQTCVFYLQEDLNWYSKSITLAPASTREEIALEDGYNFIKYNNSDRPFLFSCNPMSGDAVIFLNGERIQNTYDSTPFETMEPNSVIKIFSNANAIPTYALTVDNQSEGAVSILADYVNAIESTEAQVIGTTDIMFEITETAAETAASTAPYVIKVNDTEVTANAEGNFIATITADSKIEVTKSETDPVNPDDPDVSIVEISAEKAGNIYNLQGVKVINPKKGIFISNGKKIVL